VRGRIVMRLLRNPSCPMPCYAIAAARRRKASAMNVTATIDALVSLDPHVSIHVIASSTGTKARKGSRSQGRHSASGLAEWDRD
jgi:hypothetical protein